MLLIANNELAANVGEKCSIGTLSYTKAGLVMLFIWLLWGDFFFILMSIMIPIVLPLKLNQLGASNTLIGLFVTTIPSIVGFSVIPIISFRSDRYRSHLGRRIPFLMFATPFVSAFLILIGFSEEVGGFLHGLIADWIHISPKTVILSFIGLIVIFFQIFHMVNSSVYYYLFNDVVPTAFLARFLSLVRVVGLVVGVVFNMFIFRYAEAYAKEIFSVTGLLYFVGFFLMCWKVKEGRYPPPNENVDGKQGILSSCRTYAVECFTNRFYWYFFLANTFWAVTNCFAVFTVFANKSLGLNLEQLGYIAGWSGLTSMIISFPAGLLSDRYHPFRVAIVAMIASIPITAMNMIFLFYDFHINTTLIIVYIITFINVPVYSLYAVSAIPMYMKLMPKDRYGQFGSADAMVRCLGMIIGSILVGIFMDVMKNIHNGDPFYYRYALVGMIPFQIISVIFMLLVYRYFKKLGGVSNYSAP